MSANLIVDIGNTCQYSYSIAPSAGVAATPASGVIVGDPVNMLHANTFCNLFVTGGPSNSGQFRVAVQTSDSTASGSFTDPTSGLAAFPTSFLSGGILVVNSGNNQQSGVSAFAGFQRPGQYARAIILSGDQYNAPVFAGFVSQKKITGSGGGFTYSPGSGSVNV